MKEAKNNWISNYRIHSFDCNNRETARLPSIARFLQETAWEHAEDCGAGYRTLLPHGYLWVLYGLRMEIMTFPVWNDRISVETWGKKYENLFAYRDFIIKKEGHRSPIIKASSSWLLVDSKSHRPQRIGSELQKIPRLERDALTGKPGTVKLPVEYDHPPQKRKIVFSEIDIYNHVNNTSYIKFCIDSSRELQSNGHNLKSFDIRFVQETRLDENLEIFLKNDQENDHYFLGVKKENGKEVFRARASF